MVSDLTFRDQQFSQSRTYHNIDIADIEIFDIGFSDLVELPVELEAGGRKMWVRLGDHKVVGRVLVDVRQRAGVSQDELAVRLGKPQSFISNYERAQRRLDVLEFVRIVETLGADPRRVFAELLRRCAMGAKTKTK